MILCLSIHHTGTWTSLSWLQSHRDVKGFLQEAHAHDALAGDEVVHHVESGDYPERFHPMMVYHEHLNRDRNSKRLRIAAGQMILLATHPTLIPIRDPLASLVTYQHWADRDGRSAEIGARFSPRIFVDTWCALAASWPTISRFAHVRFVTWDRMLPGEMAVYLEGVRKNLGLKDGGPAKAWADHEIRDNDGGHYPLKDAYLAGQSNVLRKGIAENGYNYLVAQALHLRPFLEALGYQDLQWWS